MSGIRVLVGTKKGAFILTSDGKRQKWDITGPHFGGWEMYHLKGSPVDPNRIYASQTSGWFGQIIQRSDDGGKTWFQPGTPPGQEAKSPEGIPDGREQQVHLRHRTAQRQTAHHAPVVRRHAAPVGIQTRLAPRAVAHRPRHRLRRRRRRRPLQIHRRRHQPGTNSPASAATAPARNGRPAPAAWVCTRSCSTARIPTASSSRSPPPAHSAPMTPARPGQPINRGLRSQYIPDPDAQVGHCVHRIAMHPSRPDTLYMQKHWDVMRTDNTGDQWTEVSGNLPTDFGFPIEVHAHEPETVYVVPITSDSLALSARRQAPRLPQPQPAATTGSRSPKACRKRTAT